MRIRTLALLLLLFLASPLLAADPQAQTLAEPIGVLHIQGEQIAVYA